MEKIFIVCISWLLLSTYPFNDSTPSVNALEGAWEMVLSNDSPSGMRGVLTIQSPYAFLTVFDEESKQFYRSQGGMIEVLGNTVFYTVEFNTEDTTDIGRKYELVTEVKANKLMVTREINGQQEIIHYTRIDSGNSDLAGSWRITNRMRDGEMRAMRLGTRKTIKMITGSRFQWVAFDPASKRFSGTGGGTALIKDGKYVENIEFFSRNPDRVGASLSFEYKVQNDEWIHSGLSSSGNPIREIWTRQ
jgi:hypothetical protein